MKTPHARWSRKRMVGVTFAVMFVLLLVVTVVLHGRHHQPSVAARPMPASPTAGPNPTVGPPVPSPSAMRTGPDITPGSQSAIARLVSAFIAAAYDYDYTDGPNTTAQRCAPLITTGFQGTLPQAPSPQSNAGANLIASRTTATAYVNSSSDIVYNWTQAGGAQVTVAFVIATHTGGSSASTLTPYTATITVAKTASGWKVSGLLDGGGGP